MVANKNVKMVYEENDPMAWLKRINEGLQAGRYSGAKGAQVRVVPNYMKKRGRGSKG